MSNNKTILATAFFDGQPIRRPLQSFSDTTGSGNDGKSEFLRQLHEDRQKREIDRRRTQAALKIQSYFRRYKCRRLVRKQFRDTFDEQMNQEKTPARIEEQIRRLLLFFSPEIDGERLIWICQYIVKSYGSGDRKITPLTKFFLICCLRYLKYAAPKGQNISIAMPLRCLEVVLLDDHGGDNNERWAKVILINGLIDNGYYETLRYLLDHRTPSADLISEQTKAPTFQAESFMKAVVGPLNFMHSSRSLFSERKSADSIITNAWKGLVDSFLAQSPMTPIIRYYVLPYLASLTDLISLDGLASRVSQVVDDELIVDDDFKTPEFAFSLAYFATKLNLGEARSSFVGVYSTVSQSLLELIPQQINRESGFNDEDDEDGGDDKMDVDGHDSDRQWILNAWLSLNHTEKLINYLSNLTETESKSQDDTTLTAVIDLCRVHWSAEQFRGYQCRFLQMLAYQPKLIRRLWQSIVTCTAPSIMGPPRPLIEQLQKGYLIALEDRRRLVPLLSVFCALFSTTLAASSDEDFFTDLNLKPRTSTIPFSRPTLASLSSILRDIALGLIELALPDSRPTVSEQYREALMNMGADFSRQDTSEWNQLFEAVVRLLKLLHDRDERLQFCPIGYWSVKNRVAFHHVKSFRSDHPNNRRHRRLFNVPRYLTRQQLEEEQPFIQSSAELRDMTILRKIPFVVPFEQRVELLYQLIASDQHDHGIRGVWQAGLVVNARRNYLYEDGFDQLSRENVPNLRQRIRVRLQNWAGAVEAGVDGGGLFREFLNELLKNGFDPQRGFFVATAHDSSLYPNPLAPALFRDEEYKRHYFFLGRMVGKLIYENQLAELRFSRFFLAQLLRPTTDVDVHHMAYYDPILYKNLLRLKNEDDVSKLFLDFSVVVEELGELQTLDLQPNGRNITVNNGNRLEYIQLVAEFYLHHRIKGQCDAFRAGLSDLIDLDWLQMFDYRELQVLISGADREIDVDDLRNNTSYHGEVEMEGGELTDKYMIAFWEIVSQFTGEQKKKLLKFVTSCSRPPLLGFKDLHPPFTIQIYSLRAGESDRLPSAATCSNLLKLPRFQDKRTLRDKLLYAIEAGSGFELS